MFISPAFQVKRIKKPRHLLFNFASGKDIGFELEQLGLPNDVKTSQNTTANHTSLPAAVVSTQQTKIPVTQNTSQSLFVTPSNGNPIRNQKTHGGFPCPPGLVTIPTPSFPSESLDIPSIHLAQSQNGSLLRFPPNLMQSANLANQIHVQQLQNVQNTTNLLSENVATFSDASMDESDDFIEGPLDKIVDQIMDRERSQASMKTSAISNTAYGQHPSVSFTSMPSHETLPAASSLTSGNLTNSIPTTQSKPTPNLLEKIPVHTESLFTLRPTVSAGSNMVRTNSVLRQSPVSSVPLNNRQKNTVSAQKATTDIEELLKIQQLVRSSTNNVVQSQFLNQLPSSNSSEVLTSSLRTSPVVVAKPTNTAASYSFNQNTANRPISMPHVLLENVLQDVRPQSLKNKQQTPSIGSTTEKMTFVTTASANSMKDVSSMQRSTMPSAVGSPSVTTKTSVLRTGNQLELRDMSGLVSPMQEKDVLHSSLGIPQATSTKPNLNQAATSPNTTKPFQFFSKANTPTISLAPPKTEKPAANRPSPTFLSISSTIPKQTTSPSEQSAGGTVLKITSPSTNILSGLQQPVNRSSPTISTQHQFFSQTSPVLSTAATHLTPSATPTTTSLRFSNIQRNPQPVSGSLLNPSKSMVFTLAPGTQAATALKALPLLTKEKMAGRQIFFLQQPGQGINASKPTTPNMKIVFVNEGLVPQLVSGPPKSTMQSSPVQSPSPVVASTQASITKTVLPPPTSTSPVTTSQSSTIYIDESPSAGSPSSNNSSDSESISIAVQKQTEVIKRKSEDEPAPEKKKRGKYRKKDPNRPVKPLSSFQKFFQKTQVSIRQKFPSATFPDVSKIAKTMWDNLSAKEKKVYQDEWRLERVQYKKAMAEYEVTHGENTTDGPSPQKIDQPVSSPVPVSPVEAPRSVSPVSSNSSTSSSSGGTTSSSTIIPVAGPHGGGKPLAMMLANKTKMASAQSSGKVSGTKSSKTKASSNGSDDSLVQVAKKKQKINPIPKKPCIRESCTKFSKTTKERGTLFCSNECVMLHCRSMFKSWVDARRSSYKAVS